MVRSIAAVAVSLIAGFAVAVWLLGEGSSGDVRSVPDPEAGQFDSSSPAEERLRRLERAIAEEREARVALEEQLRALLDEVERIDVDGPRVLSERQAQAEEMKRQARQDAQQRPRDISTMMRNMQERRLKSLIDGGFPDDEARRILQLESAVQYQALQAAHEAQRAGESLDQQSLIDRPQALLRQQLGDSDYERYLEAQGQATAVRVTQVLDSSPGSRAGLQPGDEIVSYNGERVFTVSDLRSLTLQGTAGEDVVIEIERAGVRMQLNVQRGPVGITGTSASIRGANWWGGT